MRNRAAALSPALNRGLAHNTFDLDVRSIILTGSSAAIKGTLRRDQGRAPFLPADLDLGFQRSSHSVKCRQPGPDPTPVAFPQHGAPSRGQVVQNRLVTWLPGDLIALLELRLRKPRQCEILRWVRSTVPTPMPFMRGIE